MHRTITALMERQESWARPLGGRAQQWLAELFARAPGTKDVLNGTWLGHPVHPAITDVPVGALTVALVLDVAGHDRAADVAVATGLAGMAAAAPTGAADAVDAHGRPQVVATVHASLMAASLGAYLASLALRVGPRAGRPYARALAYAGYGALAVGAYVGGDLTYRLGNQVDRHAFRSWGTKWKAIDVGEVPEGRPVKAMHGSEPLVLVRDGDEIRALHATCAHAGGPLDQGRLIDGCIECPWHQSQYRLADGHVVQGPAVYDQPVYEVRRTPDGGLEARLAVGS